MNLKLFGHSSQGIPLLSYDFFTKNEILPRVLILGAVHGDEIEGAILAQALIADFITDYKYSCNTLIIPHANIEGVLYKTRGNFNGVDLNRNLPTQDWSPEIKNPRYHPGPFANSEPENHALVHCLNTFKPDFILSLHSYDPMINVNGDCLKQAEILHQMTGYKIVPDMGYPTPGCLGTYAWTEKKIPCITYEIQRGMSAKDILKVHLPAIIEMMKSFTS